MRIVTGMECLKRWSDFSSGKDFRVAFLCGRVNLWYNVLRHYTGPGDSIHVMVREQEKEG